MQEDSPSANAFKSLAANVVEELKLRNDILEPTKAVEITNMDGCSS
jgi:hypothetical protein